MEAIAAALIAVTGTLMGSAVTYVFQRRVTERGEELARRERRRHERIDAYAAYAGAVHNYRRMEIHRWFVKNGRLESEDFDAVTREVFELRSDAMEALFRLQLLTDDPAVRERANAAMDAVGELHDVCLNRAELDTRRDSSRAAIQDFIAVGSAQVS
ncbi:hypothetical protein [Streptomyces gobiensis]|uniref:hypothetical protein n=1 Tax=Streptomyces gobiensis TaxID=2875706 RepID=UPI001E3563F0|nr:hypothetical protein [Streptomyces gobiensis]UGY92034.1 hypothetical protein test1122_10070 [Streptomyces gobiensis]